MLTHHARERCAEMGISTKVAKRIVQHARVTYRAANTQSQSANCRIALCCDYPEYAVVFDQEPDGRQVIVTVVFNTPGRYERQGETFIDLTDKVTA